MAGDFGVFHYNSSGFEITLKYFRREINWQDITQINVFKTDQMTSDRIEMEIIYHDKILNITEDLPGWNFFVQKVKEIFPVIPTAWDLEIIQPPFVTNYRIIYKK